MKKILNILPVLAGACWGSSGIFVRVLYEAGFDNMSITFARLSVTVLLIGIVILIKDKSLFRIQRRDVPLLMVSGFFGYFLMNLFYNSSINLLSLSLASILLCTAPVYVIIFGAIVFKEKITPLKIICLVGVVVGCVLLSGIVESGALQWSVYGILMGVFCSMSNAVCTMGCNEASGVRGIDALTVLFYNAFFALIPTIFLADFGTIGSFIAADPAKGLGLLFVNATVASLLPNLFFNMSFKYMESGVVSILASGAEPTAALIFGILLFSEVPTLVGFIGMVVVIGSIIVLTSAKSEKVKTE